MCRLILVDLKRPEANIFFFWPQKKKAVETFYEVRAQNIANTCSLQLFWRVSSSSVCESCTDPETGGPIDHSFVGGKGGIEVYFKLFYVNEINLHFPGLNPSLTTTSWSAHIGGPPF